MLLIESSIKATMSKNFFLNILWHTLPNMGFTYTVKNPANTVSECNDSLEK
jgi:hypothetical protein